MNINNIEDLIKNALEQHRPETDNEAIWEQIEPKLKKKKKRRFLILLFFTAGLGLLVCLFVKEKSASKQHDTQANAQTDTAPSARKQPSAVQNGGTDTKTVVIGTPALRNEATGIRNSGSIEANAMVTDDANGTNEGTTEPTISVAERPAIDLGVPVATDTMLAKSIALLPVVADSLAYKNSISANALWPVPNPEQDERFKKKRRRGYLNLDFAVETQFLLGTGIAPAILTERYEANAPSGHLKGRRKTESSIEAYNFDWVLAGVNTNGFVVRTGLSYRQANDRFRLAYNTVESFTATGVLTRTVDANGAVIDEDSGNKTFYKTTDYNNTAYSQYRFINLPLGVGRRKMYKNGAFEWTAGLDFNLMFRANAKIYNLSNEVIDLKPGMFFYNQYFRKRLGLGAWANYSYSRKWKEDVDWIVALNTQLTFRTVTASTYAVSQRYLHLGIQGGVVYHIGH